MGLAVFRRGYGCGHGYGYGYGSPGRGCREELAVDDFQRRPPRGP
jgi:hypothetical protein